MTNYLVGPMNPYDAAAGVHIEWNRDGIEYTAELEGDAMFLCRSGMETEDSEVGIPINGFFLSQFIFTGKFPKVTNK